MLTRKFRILFVIARMNKGGTSKYLSTLAQELPKFNFDVAIATGYVQGDEIEDEVISNLNILRINHLGRRVSIVRDLLSWWELRACIKKYNPDVIYSHTFKAGLISRLQLTRIPKIHAFHGHLIDEPELKGTRIRIVMFIEKLLAPRAKLLVSVGIRVSKELVQNGVGEPSKFRSIAPGVKPLSLIDPLEAKRKLGIENENRPIVVWMARTVAVKAPFRVIEIARALPNIRFLLAGGGDLFQELVAKAPENLLVLGWQPGELMWSVANLAISTSENEGMPIALIEAQLAGVPVIALDVGSVSEIVEDQVTGYVFKTLNAEYIQTINKTLNNSENLKSLSEAAKVKSHIKFSTEKLIQDHVKLFNEIL